MTNGKGWHGDSYKHALASHGVSLKSNSKSVIIKSMQILNSAIEKTARGRIREKVEEANEEVNHKNEWIGDLDLNEDTEVVLTDIQQSDEPDESELNWNNDITHKDPYPDPEHCIGYLHYHPPSVDPRASVQDFILALTIHEMRSDKNKEKHPETIFGVVTDDKTKYYAINPDDSEQTKELFKSIQNKNYDTSENHKYFEDLRTTLDELKSKGHIKETDWEAIQSNQSS